MSTKKLVRRGNEWFRLGRMPRGYRKTGESFGGKKPGSGRKRKEVKNVRVSLTVKESTKIAISRVPVSKRVELFSAALESAIDAYLEGGK